MKTLKVSAFALAFVIAITSAFAFNTHKTLTTYRYNGTTQNIGDLSDGSKWAAGLACGASGNKVCSMDFDGNKAAFDIYISSFSSQTPTDVYNRAEGHKN